MGSTHIETRTHLESLSLMPQTTLVQHGDHADNDILSQAHERMIQTAQRKMLRFSVQPKRHYKAKSKEEAKDNSVKGAEKKKMTLFV